MSRLRLSAMGSLLLGACALAVPLSATSRESQLPASGVSCYLPPAKLFDQAVAQFLANPASLLAAHRNGGITFLNFVQQLTGSDVRTVGPLIEVARNAAPAIKTDIAAGLANTAASCSWTRPDIALLFHERIAASKEVQLITAFLEVSSAIQTAAASDVPTRNAGGGAVIGRSAFGSDSEIEPTATRQGGGLPRFVGFDRRTYMSSKSNNANNSSGTTNPGSTIGLGITNSFDSIVRSNYTIGTDSSNSVSRLLTPEGPVSQTVQ
jgi:hypothetical protein